MSNGFFPTLTQSWPKVIFITGINGVVLVTNNLRNMTKVSTYRNP